MCVSTGQADFSGTILYGGRRDHPEHGAIEVLGYQNTAVNLATGPNAMLLHLPSPGVTPSQFISVGPHGDVLTRMVDAVRPVSRGAGIAWMDAGSGVQVFEHDVYTVVLAGDPTRITGALNLVPEHKRPSPNPELLEFYRDAFPDHSVALCCFDNAAAQRAKPLLIWYEPLDPDRIVLPALDCHTGAAPDPDAPARRDHWLLFGSDETTAEWGRPVDYPPGMRHALRAFLPDRVTGVEVTGDRPNGDFAISLADLRSDDLTRIEVVAPSA
jgi:hypothetical protein